MKTALIARAFLVAMLFGSFIITFHKLTLSAVLTSQEISVIAMVESILLGMASFAQLKMDYTSKGTVLVMLTILCVCELAFASLAFVQVSPREYILWATGISFIAGPLHIIYQYGASKLSAKYITLKVNNFVKYFAGILAAGVVSVITSTGLHVWDVFPYVISVLVSLIGFTRIAEIVFILGDKHG